MGKARNQTTESSLLQEIIAIIMVGLGLLLFLALVSFDPHDLPFFASPPNDPYVNFIGPLGAYFGGALYIGFGFASYLVPLIMVVGGGLLVFYKEPIDYRLKGLWFFLIMVSGAGLLQLIQPLVGSFTVIEWPGGWVGNFINDTVLSRLLGRAGAVIILGLVYLISMVMLFEVHPVTLAKKVWQVSRDWYEAREQAKLEAADPLERLELERKRIEREEKKLRRKLGQAPAEEPGTRSGRKVKAPVEPPAPVEEVVRPEPKVIDSMETPAPAMEEHVVEEPSGPEEEILVPKAAPARIARERSPKGGDSIPVPAAAAAPSYDNYKLPEIDLLKANESDGRATINKSELEENRQLLVDTIRQFGVEVTPGDITRGATITRYEVYPAPGVRVERISSLDKNIARAMKAERVNILAPIPGKDSIGIEVPNSQKATIVLRDLFESDSWRRSKATLPIAIGKDVYGSVLVADLASMPHLLIAGTTGSGKSVCINSILLSLMYKFSPDDLKLILVDPKVVELQIFNKLPHLVVPVVTEPKKVLIALRWAINEMEKRYRLLARAGVRNIVGYNSRKIEKKSGGEKLGLGEDLEGGGQETPDALPGLEDSLKEEPMPDRLPYVVLIIDELADLMATAPADVETAIARLSAKARAAGIHLIIATQTPRAQVITGVIKTNVPCRIAFQVPGALDSRVILDENGAENLLGKGDLLYLPPGSAKLVRAQGAFVSDEEVARVVDFIGDQCEPTYEQEIHKKLSRPGSNDEEVSEADAELIRKCFEIMRDQKRASTSHFQRQLRIGYTRAAWVTDWFEGRGILGPKDGVKDREILVDLDQFDIEEML